MSEAEQIPNVEVLAVPASQVEEFYPHARPFIRMALDRYPGEIAEAEVAVHLQSGRKQLWIAWEGAVVGAAVTEIAQYAEFAAVRVVALGGDHFDWQPQMDALLDRFAKVHNCERIEFVGRHGWVRKLPHYHLLRVTMVRDVDGR